MAVIIGTASVKVTLDSTGFKQKVETDVGDKLKTVGEDDWMSPGLAKNEANAKKSSTNISGIFSSMFKAIKVTGIAYLGSLVPEAATSLVQLSGLLGLVPGIAFAGAAAIGTLAIGTQGFSQALKDAGNQKAFAADLKNLAPNAADAAKAFQGLTAQFKAMRLDVQQQLFAGLGDAIKTIGDQYLPILKVGLGGIAGELNTFAQQTAKFLKFPDTAGDFSNAFGDIKVGLGNLVPAWNAVLIVVDDLVTVSTHFLPSLGTSISNVAAKFATFIDNARNTGQLAGWIQGGITAFKQLITIVGNVSDIVIKVFGAMNASGVGLFATLDLVTTALKDWVNTTGAIQFLASLSTTIQDIGKDFAPVLIAAFQGAQSILTTLIPYIQKLAGLVGPSLASDLQKLQKPLDDFANGIGKLATGPLVHVILTALTALVNIIAGLDQNFPTLNRYVGTFIALWATAKFTGVIGQLGKLGTAIGGVGTAVEGAAASGAASGSGGLLSLLGFGSAGALTLGGASIVLPIVAFFAGIGILAANAFKQDFSGQNPFVKAVNDSITAGQDAANSYVNRFGTHLAQGFAGALGFMVPNTSSILSSVGQVINTLGPGLWGQFGAAGQKSQLAWDTGLATLPAETNAVIKSAGSVIASDTSVPNAAIGLANNAKALFTGGLATLPPLVSGIVGQMGQAIVIGAPSIWSAAAAAGAGTTASYINQFAPAPGQARSIVSEIVSAVQVGLSPMSAIGSAAGGALISGLASALKNGQGLIGKIGSDITQTLLNTKGPLSRDRVLWKPAGEAIVASLFDALNPAIDTAATTSKAIMKSLIDGISGQVPTLNGVLGSVSDSITGGLAAPASQIALGSATPAAPLGAAGSNQALVQINAYQQPGQDVLQFASQVSQIGAQSIANAASTVSVIQQPVQVGATNKVVPVGAS